MTQKLVLFDIFSYSCMNCLRSLEFIKKINHKYRKYGLKTIIIHTPEWEFEKKNISNALKRLKTKIPIKVDKKIIKKLKVNFWPAQILVKNDKILYKHIGEGSYKKLEYKIIKTLKLKIKPIFEKEPKYSKFPTLYAGKKKKGNISKLKNKLTFGTIYTEGKWIQTKEYMQNSSKGSLTILTKGKIISFVARSLKPIKIKVYLNNKFIKNMTINKPKLYEIIKLNNNKLTLKTKNKIKIYSFSFQ